MKTAICALLLLAAAPRTAVAEDVLLDAFEDVAGWTTTASDGVTVTITPEPGREGMSLRVDVDFGLEGGFAIVRKEFAVELPENYAFTFDLRGDSARSDLEFKLVSPDKTAVWWRRFPSYVFPIDWEPVIIRKARIEDAWGVPRGTKPKKIGAVEFGLRGMPGRGTIWIDNLRLEERELPSRFTRTAAVTASAALPKHEPKLVVDGDPKTSWKSGPVAGDQTLVFDLGRQREFGGLVVEWDPKDFARSYDLEKSTDGETWTKMYESRMGNGGDDYLYLPDSEARYLRLLLRESSRGQGYGVLETKVKGLEFSNSLNDFVKEISRDAPPGWFPRYFQGRQTFWTVFGAPGDDEEGLINTDGTIEVGKSQFSIEPFLHMDGKLVSWNAVDPVISLEDGYLPIPSVRWLFENVLLTITAFGSGERGDSTLYGIYRVENAGEKPRTVDLLLAVRPYQVNPPTQSLNMEGGASPIRTMTWDGRTLEVNREVVVIPLATPDGFGATNLELGPLPVFLDRGELPPLEAVDDPFGFGSGAFRYTLSLAPGESREIAIAIPLHHRLAVEEGPPEPPGDPAVELRKTTDFWRKTLDRVGLDLPNEAARAVATLRSGIAHILINRDGPRIQPGSRNYARSWIRDGALTAAALLEMGYNDEARDFFRWYAKRQFENGYIPCCVDQFGADTVPEHDSHGQFLYGLMEVYLHTRDVSFLTELWPAAVKTADYIISLRAQRMTEAYQTPAKRAYYGLLPQSISHEGYASKPVHSYWDDFFGVRGLEDAARMATILGDDERAERYGQAATEFAANVHESMRIVMEERGLKTLPASVELADYDPASTAIAPFLGGGLSNLDGPALGNTFDRYLEEFRLRREGKIEWQNFAPYELRNATALILLNRRDEALELLHYFLGEQRPTAWNQWPEIVWRDTDAAAFLGDLPHTWIASSFIHTVRSMIAWERDTDEALVLAAGIPEAWVEGKRRVAVKRLPTHHGILAFELRGEGEGKLRLRLSGDINVPKGGIVIRPPISRALRSVTVNGKQMWNFRANEAIVREFPATVLMEY